MSNLLPTSIPRMSACSHLICGNRARHISSISSTTSQIVSKQCRLQSLEPLDAVRNNPLTAREKPTSGNVDAEDGDSTKPMATTWTT
jgi:hypothetical protein